MLDIYVCARARACVCENGWRKQNIDVFLMTVLSDTKYQIYIGPESSCTIILNCFSSWNCSFPRFPLMLRWVQGQVMFLWMTSLSCLILAHLQVPVTLRVAFAPSLILTQISLTGYVVLELPPRSLLDLVLTTPLAVLKVRKGHLSTLYSFILGRVQKTVLRCFNTQHLHSFKHFMCIFSHIYNEKAMPK